MKVIKSKGKRYDLVSQAEILRVHNALNQVESWLDNARFFLNELALHHKVALKPRVK